MELETTATSAHPNVKKCQDFINLIGEDVYLVCNGRRVDKEAVIDENKIYRICHRLPGGKGGFGSMLRTIGAQIEKTTNREAMRDLSGRRMRDINNEKRLADWVAGAGDREKQREERRKERLEKRRAEAEGRMHKFRDEQYMEQKDKVSTNLDDALTQGLKRASGSASGAPQSKKGKSAATASWSGLNVDDLSSSDEDVSSSEDSGRGATARAEDFGTSVPSTDSKPEDASSSSIHQQTNQSSCNKQTDQSNTDNETVVPGDGHHSTPVTESDKEAPAQSVTESKNQPPAQSVTESESQPHAQSVTESDKQTPAQSVTETSSDSTESIDLESQQSAEELEEYGLERLKQELMRRGLKCGGSLEQRAQRLYSVKGLSDSDISPSLFAKKKK